MAFVDVIMMISPYLRPFFKHLKRPYISQESPHVLYWRPRSKPLHQRTPACSSVSLSKKAGDAGQLSNNGEAAFKGRLKLRRCCQRSLVEPCWCLSNLQIWRDPWTSCFHFDLSNDANSSDSSATSGKIKNGEQIPLLKAKTVTIFLNT